MRRRCRAANFALPALLVVGVLNAGTPVAAAQTAPPARVVAVDYAKVKGKHNTFFREVVGAGRAAEGLRADWQEQLATVHRECGFKYVRFHGLLQDEMGVYNEDKLGHPVYNFQYVDALYDAILKIGMKPFVELSFMPSALSSGGKTVFWWKGNVTPPQDYTKWANLIGALTRHWTERYGADEVRQWYFEVWNEPNLDIFWSGSQADYFHLYEVTARAIKAVSADYRVGGPATAGNGWIPETIDFAARNQVPLDFISTHDYGVRGSGFDEGVQQLYLVTAPGAIVDNVRRVRGEINASARPELPLHYTEWSTSYSPRDPVHDSYLSAPYILAKLKGAEGYADSMSYWTFTDVFEENGPVPSPFHGGFGLINFQGLRKPSFYAYQFLHRLGNDELASNDRDSWSCRNDRGVQILFWNFTPPLTQESDQKFYRRDPPSAEVGPARVSVAGLPAGSYRVNVYRIGYHRNDVYGDYLSMGAPANLQPAQVKRLAEQNDGHPVDTARVQVTRGHDLVRVLTLHENDVYLITMEADRDPRPTGARL